ncbi:hypothetical protein [Providencia manganoxydans]|uniref:hypothetical protein n=1 Tax=Providencia manganoxydans TaxID=2923283 RepID=UPI003DA0C05B
MIVPTDLIFRPASELPTENLDGRSVIVLNPCDGWHIGEIRVIKDEDGCYIGVYPWMGDEMTPHDFYVTWALLPDNDDLIDEFEGEQSNSRHCCVCKLRDHSTAEHKS